jgi:hypothetical protein
MAASGGGALIGYWLIGSVDWLLLSSLLIGSLPASAPAAISQPSHPTKFIAAASRDTVAGRIRMLRSQIEKSYSS